MSEEVLDLVAIHLPSKCKTYKDVNPDSIRIRPFRGKDEELVVSLGTRNPKKKIMELMKNILVGIEPEQLTSGDVDYILLWEAINSYSRIYPIKLTCKACLQLIEFDVDLSTLNVKELPDDFVQPYEVSLSNTKVFLRLLTLKDNLLVLDYTEKGLDGYLYSYALSIVEDKLNILSKVELLKEMKTNDLAKIRKFHEDFYHGPDYVTKYTCPKCGEDGEVIVPFRLDEFIRISQTA